MIVAASDTHGLIWFAWDDPRLSRDADQIFTDASRSGDQIAISSICLVEIVYLMEKGRVDPRTLDHVLDLLDRNQVLIEVNVTRAILKSLAAIPRIQVPDMPDRIIAATAAHLGVPLVSRDRKIQASSVTTVW